MIWPLSWWKRRRDELAAAEAEYQKLLEDRRQEAREIEAAKRKAAAIEGAETRARWEQEYDTELVLLSSEKGKARQDKMMEQGWQPLGWEVSGEYNWFVMGKPKPKTEGSLKQ